MSFEREGEVINICKNENMFIQYTLTYERRALNLPNHGITSSLAKLLQNKVC